MRLAWLKIFLLAMTSISITGLALASPAPVFIFDRLGQTPQYPDRMKTRSQNSLTVMWWNIRNGGELSQAQPDNPLETNLSSLASMSYAPEVIVLGEFVEGRFSPATQATLEAKYPYHFFTRYGVNRPEMGIQVYSQYPFTETYSLLDWSPRSESSQGQIEFKNKWRRALNPNAEHDYERVFIDLKLTKGNRIFHIVPNHILNPWNPLASQIGRKKAGLVLMFGTDNPHYCQIERLMKDKIRPLLSRLKTEHSSLVMLGDFNMPDELYGVTPVGFNMITRRLKPSVAPLFSNYTFPALSSDMTAQTKMRIDQSFVDENTDVDSEARIPFSGSDHYPIALKVIQPVP